MKHIQNFENFIFEANKGNYYPLSIEEYSQFIESYKNTPELIFVSLKTHFGDYKKMNYKFSHNTPLAIYTYPYKGFLENDKYISDKSLNFDVPYMNGARYAYVYIMKSLDGVLTFQSEDSQKKATSILRKIRKDHPELKDVNLTKTDYYSSYVKDKSNPVYKLYLSCSFLASKSKDNNPNIVISSIFRKYGITGFIDNGEGFIHRNEPTQALFFDINLINTCKIIDREKNKSHFLRKKLSNIDNDQERKKTIILHKAATLLELRESKLTINEDFTLNYDGYLDIHYHIHNNIKELKKLGIKFRYVSDSVSIDGYGNKDVDPYVFEMLPIHTDGNITLKHLRMDSLNAISHVNKAKVLSLSTIEGLENLIGCPKITYSLIIQNCVELKTLNGLRQNNDEIKYMSIENCDTLFDFNDLPELEDELKISNWDDEIKYKQKDIYKKHLQKINKNYE